MKKQKLKSVCPDQMTECFTSLIKKVVVFSQGNCM